MTLITSIHNPAVMLVHKLQQKKYRDQLGLCVVDNPLTVRDGLHHGAQIKSLLVSESFATREQELFSAIATPLKPETIVRVSDALLQKVCPTEHSQGMIAVCRIQSIPASLDAPVVYLDGVSDPGNVGAILRTSAAFGVRSIMADMDSADFYNPKTVAAAKESIFMLSLSRVSSAALADVRKKMPVYGLAVNGATPLQEVEWQYPFCLVLGNEARGISPDAYRYLSTSVAIEMAGGSVESLNVASATAIALYRAFHSR